MAGIVHNLGPDIDYVSDHYPESLTCKINFVKLKRQYRALPNGWKPLEAFHNRLDECVQGALNEDGCVSFLELRAQQLLVKVSRESARRFRRGLLAAETHPLQEKLEQLWRFKQATADPEKRRGVAKEIWEAVRKAQVATKRGWARKRHELRPVMKS